MHAFAKNKRSYSDTSYVYFVSTKLLSLLHSQVDELIKSTSRRIHN